MTSPSADGLMIRMRSNRFARSDEPFTRFTE
jgi:hypothetical protein